MADIIPEETRFHSAPRYDLKDRPSGAAPLIRRVARGVGLESGGRVPDQGCGADLPATNAMLREVIVSPALVTCRAVEVDA